MPTTFVLHEFSKEHATDGLIAWPTWGYTDWTYELVASRRDGSSPTLDVAVQVAPVRGARDLWEDLTTFTQVTGATALPHTETKEGGTDFAMEVDARFQRLHQTVSGTWWYKLTGTVKLFDPAKGAHTDLLQPRVADYSGLATLADEAEDDVVRHFTERRPTTHLSTVADVSQSRRYDRELWTTRGRLMLVADEDTGEALREAIARRTDWLFRRRELEQSGKEGDATLLRRHLRREWEDVEAALRHHDDRTPAYMM